MLMNLPNKLTLLRVCLIPVFLIALLGEFTFLTGDAQDLVAVFIFIVASLTDWLDGFIARSRNMVTTFGKFADPLADKVLVASALIAMVELGLIASWVAITIISREFIITGFRLVAAEKSVVIAAGFWGKMKTAVTLVMIIFVLFQFSFAAVGIIANILIYLSVFLTIISMVEYIVSNFDVLKDGEKK